ncbi:37111_t:CDS:2 [Gigaspora margarita]|uniref:37111_t:CDS:1 n=1 Tax=Gigaspora margarita TaxID=4874 RepID=A0ABN7VLW1_GIGMA|nr:37111_t:CDS:2 [Gigaspora margarita]
MDPYEMIESYRMMDDDFNDYLGDFNYEVAKGSEILMEAFLSTNIRPNIQMSPNFPTPLESKNKALPISNIIYIHMPNH